MTIAADIATLGTYGATDITNSVTQAFKTISLHMGETYVEDDNDNIDEIAKQYAIYLLDRMIIQRKAKTDPNLIVPPIITKDVINLIKSQIQTEYQTWQVDSSVDSTIHWRNST